jgi:nucleotide-binding universal stress UspA family protein
MKKLLIPIDFSECSLNAVKYGLGLAKIMRAEIILCHAFAVPIPGITDTLHKVEKLYIEQERSLNAQLGKISDEISSNKDNTGNRIKCSYFLIQSSPTEGVIHYASQFMPDFIVIGTVGNNGWENILGSTTVGIIRRINRPVIVVPSGASFTSIQDILISIDFPLHGIKSIKELVKFARVQVGHVSSEEYEGKENEKLNDFKDECYKEGIRDIDFHTIRSSKASKAIIDFIETNNFQLIALLKERRAFFEGLFHQSFIKQLVMDSKRPLLILTDE